MQQDLITIFPATHILIPMTESDIQKFTNEWLTRIETYKESEKTITLDICTKIIAEFRQNKQKLLKKHKKTEHTALDDIDKKLVACLSLKYSEHWLHEMTTHFNSLLKNAFKDNL